MSGRLLDSLAFVLHGLAQKRYLNIRIEPDDKDGVTVRYRKGKAPAVSITWKSGTAREQLALVLPPGHAALVAQGIREALIEITGEAPNVQVIDQTDADILLSVMGKQ
jgi:hypothetical protein